MKIDFTTARALKNKSISNFEVALNELVAYLEANSTIFNRYTVIRGAFQAFKNNRDLGVLSGEEVRIQRNKIHLGILNIIDEITEEIPLPSKSNIKDILVVCKIEERLKIMDSLIRLGKYENIKVDDSGKELSADEVKDYKLIIFDNFPKADKEPEETLLKHYLNNTNPLLLYFGQQLDLLKEYPEKAYFSNSIFSIHSRIEEMLRFDKMTKGEYKYS